MVIAGIIEQLNELGVSVDVEGDEVVVRPGSKVPASLIPTLKRLKSQIVEYLQEETEVTQTDVVQIIPCGVCRSRRWWKRHDVKWICDFCHPNPQRLRAEWKLRQQDGVCDSSVANR